MAGSIIFIYCCSVLSIFNTGCANMMPPSGGLKDTLPPVLLKAAPEDSSLNFSGKKIELHFDEYIDLENYYQTLIISPVPKEMPTVTRKLKTITINLKDSLEPNTTYTFDLSKTVKDLNEGNKMTGYVYIFSTGNYIDSLELTGRVIIAETGLPDSTLTVMLHTNGVDSSVIKTKPRYVTRTDRNGYFRFKHLPQGTYWPYAIKDESGQFKYMDKQQLFAFTDTSIQVSTATDSVTLYAFSIPEQKEAARTPGATSRPGRGAADNRLKFTTSADNRKQGLLDSFSINFSTPVKNFDSTKIVVATDSTFTPVTGYSWLADSTRQKYTLLLNLQEKTQYHLIVQKDFATDTNNLQLLKADTISFVTKGKDEYARLNLRFKNYDAQLNPVLLLLQNGKAVYSYPLQQANLVVPMIEPGDYELRLLYDRNKNGIWDTGDLFNHRQQPELAKPLTRKLTVKPKLDVPIEIDLLQ